MTIADQGQGSAPGRLHRALQWGSSSRLTKFVDLAFKSTALIAAVLAANFFQLPRVILQGTPRIQTYLDVGRLEESYQQVGHSLPRVVWETAHEYNGANEEDILSTVNSTHDLHPPSELCKEMRELVIRLFPHANCDATSPYLDGRARYYERLLLAVNLREGSPLGFGSLREGLRRLRDAEFIVARYQVQNTGRGFATNVQVLAPEEFQPSLDQPFSLAPGDAYAVRFETDRGRVERDPTPELLATNVSWDKGAGLVGGFWIRFLIAVSIALLVWSILAEILGGQRARE